MSKATGYVSGQAIEIEVVTVDGKKVEWRTANAYMRMAKAASAAGIEIRVVSGFRTMAEQQYLYNCYKNCSCNNCNLAAKPGHSNHQSGHALDLNTSAPGVYSWMSSHAGKYGFKRTVPSEAWHWEWWGTDPGTGPCNDRDKDDDGITGEKDSCVSVKNPDQKDTDEDKKGDACDPDDDGDGTPDEKDGCPTLPDLSLGACPAASGETEVPPELGFSPGTEPVSGSCGCASAGPAGSGPSAGASALALLAALGLRRRRRA